MRASSSLELSEISMAKNLQKKFSNGFENGANEFRTSKNPYLGFFGTSFGQKMKKIGLLPFSSFKLVSSLPKHTSV